MKTKTLAIFNGLGLTVLLVLSYLVQQKRLSTLDVGEVSAKYETLFTPASLTFAIWGLIYVSLAAFCIYHIVKAFSSDEADQVNVDTRAIGWLFLINSLATGAWLIAWIRELVGLSVILILIQLITLILISIRAHIANPERPLASKLFTQFPLSIYFGWICIAAIANISAYLVSVDWGGLGISETYWVITMIGAATMLSLFIILVRRNFFFGMVTLWALYGIILKRQQTDQIQFQMIINAAWAAVVIILIALLIRLLRRKKFKTQPANDSGLDD
jgi:hypothetical protein